jgi:hypothetical protein
MASLRPKQAATPPVVYVVFDPSVDTPLILNVTPRTQIVSLYSPTLCRKRLTWKRNTQGRVL